MMLRVYVIDSHEIFRAGLKRILEQEADLEVVGEAQNALEARAVIQELNPDIVIIDLAVPLGETLGMIRWLRKRFVQTKVLALASDPDRELIAECLKIGTSAIVLKSGASVELRLAISAIRRGETYLSPKVTNLVVTHYVRERDGATRTAFTSLTAKQREVIQLLTEGKTNKEVAAVLGISPKTVEVHRAQIMEKLNIHTIAGLTKYAIREGLTSVDVQG